MRIWSLCAAAAVLALASMTAQAYQLTFKDAKGASRTTKIECNISGSMEGAGLAAPFKATSTLTETEKVTASAAGTATLTRQLKEGSTTVSTTMPGDDQPQTLKQAIPGYTFTYDRTPQGKISNLKISGDLAKSIDNSGNDTMVRFLSSGEGLEFPDRDLKIGDTWTGTQTLALGDANAEMSVKFTLAGTEVLNGKTYLKITSDLTMKVPNLKVKSILGEIPMSMEFKGATTTWFDEQAGAIFKETFKINNTTHITMPGQDVAAATMTSVIDGTSCVN